MGRPVSGADLGGLHSDSSPRGGSPGGGMTMPKPGQPVSPARVLAEQVLDEGYPFPEEHRWWKDAATRLAAFVVADDSRSLLIEADSAISHMHYRGIWPLDRFETDRLICRLREASGG